MEPTNKVLLGPSNYKIKCSGKFTGELSVNNETLNEEIYVVKGLQTPLLGRVASSKLKLIQKVDHINEVGEDYTRRVLKSYPSLFTGLGK